MSKYKLNETGYRNVQLMPSLWEDQRRYTIELYLAIPNDEILHNIRRKAGIESKVNGLGGWYGESDMPANLGQWFGAFTKLYMVTGDYRLKEKVISLAEEFDKCAVAEPAVYDTRPYSLDKYVTGFSDMYEYLGYQKAKKHISNFVDRAIQTFEREIVEYNGIHPQNKRGLKMNEWYTLPEALYRAYQVFGDDKYKDFAKEWDYRYYWDKIINDDSETIGPRHAYSHVNAFSSAAKAYEVTQDSYYLKAMEKGYDLVTGRHTYATGGYGPAEAMYVERLSYLGDALKTNWDTEHKRDPMYINWTGGPVARADEWGNCEVSCCSWAIFKFCNYLLKLTGNAKYGAWVEQALVNCTGAQIPMTSDGKILYYHSYFNDGALKSNYDRRLHPGGVNFTWVCCTGTWPLNMAEYANLIYYHDDESVYVSQYLPSKFSWEKDGVKVVINNYSNYPESEKRLFSVSVSEDVSFTLKFRVPEWADGKNAIFVNGERIDAEIKPNTWVELKREWKDGDTVTVEYPYRLFFKPVDEYSPDMVALCYGPVVLACTDMTILVGDKDHPEDWIKPVPGEPFTFVTEPGHAGRFKHITRKFVPFYKIGEMQWYFMYFRLFDKVPTHWFYQND
ncbi:MAG: beta-L-arabinofuranosidase domain-containing protein [Bacillota bacterium]|jgi:DUF1680 family protein